MRGRETLLAHLLALMVAAVVATIGLMVAWPATSQAAHAAGCTPTSGRHCYYVGEQAGVRLDTVNNGGYKCTVEFKVDWGDGSPVQVETSPPGTSLKDLKHAYASPGLYTITQTGKVIPPSDPECYTASWDSTQRIEVVSPKPLHVDVVHPSPLKKLCPNEEFRFKVSGKDEDLATWSGGGDPPSGTGREFKTRFDTPGTHTVTAKTATESDSATVDVLKPSGPAWVKKFPGSTDTSTLVPAFRKNVEQFLRALRAAGIKDATKMKKRPASDFYKIQATYRPAQRAHLMYWAYQIGNNGSDPSKVPQQDPPKAGTPPEPIVPICWMHYKADGTEDLATSRTKAKQMVAAYEIVFAPAHPSRHEIRRAIDVTIEWNGTLKIKDATGKLHKISAPRSGAKNKELWAVGKSYGVIKLKKDPPHWSDNGR